MRATRNERGIALVMVLILALISLAIVSALLFMITQGTQMSGFARFYRTAEEASFGGAEVTAIFVQSRGGSAPAGLNVLIGPLASAGSTSACLAAKIALSTASWGVSCDRSFDATSNPDLRFDLGNYRVFAKIVDTVEGNSDNSALVTGGGQLGGAGVVASNSAMISPPHIPYLYTMEIQAQDSVSVRERSRLSGLYAY